MLKRGSTLSQNTTLSKGSGLAKTLPLQRGKASTELKVHAKSGSTRLIGDRAEALVDKVFRDHGLTVEETKNSGATNFDGDRLIHISSVEGDYLRTEIKKRRSTGFTVQKDHWEDIKRKALMHQGPPAIISVNEDDNMLITLNVKDFAQIIQNLKNGLSS